MKEETKAVGLLRARLQQELAAPELLQRLEKAERDAAASAAALLDEPNGD